MKVLFLYLGYTAEAEPAFFDQEAKAHGIDVTTYSIPNHKGKRSVLLSALKLPFNQKDYDIIVTTEYFLAFAINLRLFFSGKKVKHIIYGLNKSARLLQFPIPFVNHMINRIFNQADWVVTHSRAEMALFHHAHNIDSQKFLFSHWGFDLPDINEDRFANRSRPFLSFVGRNNRDVNTFCRSIAGLDIDGVIITSENNRPDMQIPNNVEIHYDLDMDACMSCLRHAVANVVLVNDDERGAGHITIVASMLMQKPQIVSDVSVIREYVVNHTHGRLVEIGDHQAVKKAIESLLDGNVADQYAKDAYQYASKYFSNQSSSKRLVSILQDVYNDKCPPTCEPQWLAEFEGITADC